MLGTDNILSQFLILTRTMRCVCCYSRFTEEERKLREAKPAVIQKPTVVRRDKAEIDLSVEIFVYVSLIL